MEKLNCKSLMIGDWVVYTEFGKNDIDKIETLEPRRVWLEHGKTYVPIEFIEPVPLTTEILEKNGFEYMCDEYGCWLLGKIELREREPYNGLFEVEINIAKETTYIHYVHELQHALRLCGIKKEIEL